MSENLLRCTHSLVHCNLLHGDCSLVFGSHVGKHVGSKPRMTDKIIYPAKTKKENNFLDKKDFIDGVFIFKPCVQFRPEEL